MIELKSSGEIELMRRACGVTAQILTALCDMVRPGLSTADLDREAERLIERSGAESAFKNYQVGDAVYPAVLCVAVNDEIVHGIPSESCVLEEGDIVGLDFGVVVDGYFGDSAATVAVGEIDSESKRLLEVTRKSLYDGIDHLNVDERLGDVGAAVQATVEDAGFSVVRDFVGHGIGRALHEDPQIPNFGKPGRGRRLMEGMVLAVEPMVNIGGAGVKVDDDGWTARTIDGKRSSHFEHTVVITKNGPEILTAA